MVAQKKRNRARVKSGARLGRYKTPHYPSLEEVKQGDAWLTYEALIKKFDEPGSFKILRESYTGLLKEQGATPGELIGETDREYVLHAFALFMVMFGNTDSLLLDELKELERFAAILREIRDEVVSASEKEHALIEALKDAGATWPEIAAITIPAWDTLDQHDRGKAVENLPNSHGSYMGKYSDRVEAARKRFI